MPDRGHPKAAPREEADRRRRAVADPTAARQGDRAAVAVERPNPAGRPAADRATGPEPGPMATHPTAVGASALPAAPGAEPQRRVGSTKARAAEEVAAGALTPVARPRWPPVPGHRVGAIHPPPPQTRRDRRTTLSWSPPTDRPPLTSQDHRTCGRVAVRPPRRTRHHPRRCRSVQPEALAHPRRTRSAIRFPSASRTSCRTSTQRDSRLRTQHTPSLVLPGNGRWER